MRTNRRLLPTPVLLLLSVLLPLAPALAADDDGPERDDGRILVVASTTSTENSGLFGHILPRFEERTGIDVRVVAVGTGQAIRLAERGDADVLLVHHRKSEEEFVRKGFGVRRHEVMVNDFVVVGPKDDPAGVRGEEDAAAALRRIASSGALFASRGDDSGTHKRERELWRAAGVDPEAEAPKSYRATGSGMGATLNVANELGAYALTDRGTWLAFENRDHLELLVEGDARLQNPYGVILVDPKKHPHTRVAEGEAFIEWLLSDEGRAAIASFRVHGEILFRPAERPAEKGKDEAKEDREDRKENPRPPEKAGSGGSR